MGRISIYTALAFAAVAAGSAEADSFNSLMNKGNESFLKGDYKKAL
jgi:hypothetical protein